MLPHRIRHAHHRRRPGRTDGRGLLAPFHPPCRTGRQGQQPPVLDPCLAQLPRLPRWNQRAAAAREPARPARQLRRQCDAGRDPRPAAGGRRVRRRLRPGRRRRAVPDPRHDRAAGHRRGRRRHAGRALGRGGAQRRRAPVPGVRRLGRDRQAHRRGHLRRQPGRARPLHAHLQRRRPAVRARPGVDAQRRGAPEARRRRRHPGRLAAGGRHHERGHEADPAHQGRRRLPLRRVLSDAGRARPLRPGKGAGCRDGGVPQAAGRRALPHRRAWPVRGGRRHARTEPDRGRDRAGSAGGDHHPQHPALGLAAGGQRLNGVALGSHVADAIAPGGLGLVKPH
ncbi:hypothetical protein MASSI9I_50552 [Massilia sp. 9I]|nr:hypothetical protein MASSI9I_50552 [Massilia sp. 9I]